MDDTQGKQSAKTAVQCSFTTAELAARHGSGRLHEGWGDARTERSAGEHGGSSSGAQVVEHQAYLYVAQKRMCKVTEGREKENTLLFFISDHAVDHRLTMPADHGMDHTTNHTGFGSTARDDIANTL